MTIGHQATGPAIADVGEGQGAGLPFKAASAVVLAAVLAVGLPLYLVADIPDVGRSDAWIVTLAIMVYAGLRLSSLCVTGRPQLFDFFFWMFSYIFMGIAATSQIRSDQIAQTTPGMDPAMDFATAMLVVLGLFCYEVGRLVAFSRARAEQPPDASAPESRPRGVSEIRTVILLTVSLLVTLYFLVKIGPANLLGSRATAYAARKEVWPDSAVRAIVYASAIYPTLIGAGALAQIRLTGSSPAWRRAGTVGLVLTTLLLLYVVNPVGTARYSFGTVIFALAVYLGAARTAPRVRALMLGTLGGFLFLFPLADAFRNPQGTGAYRSSFFGEYLGNADYDSFWQVTNAYMFSLDGFAEPFKQLTGSVFFWVPRVIWPGKPTDTGIVLAQYRGYTFENLSAPMWAEALVNGGIVGIVVVFALMGYFLFKMDSKLTGALAKGGVWGIAGAVFPVYMTILLRGSLLQATGVLIVATVSLLFVAERRPARDPAHST